MRKEETSCKMHILPNSCHAFAVLSPPEFYLLTVSFDNFKQNGENAIIITALYTLYTTHILKFYLLLIKILTINRNLRECPVYFEP